MKPIISAIAAWMMLMFFSNSSIGQGKSIYNYSLKDLSELKVITGSVKEQNIRKAPSNITIITKQMIDERGYQTLVDLCQDVPGFDFMMFNDNPGEFSTYNMNRGIGSIGNPNILIMMDGIIQNNISFNWSLLWAYENTFVDVERIEIVQGPGSVLYGAQAFTGIIHIITRKGFEGVEASTSIGSDHTTINNVFVGNRFKHDIHASIAFHIYHTDGDQGIGRYDPGDYFQNVRFPERLTADYDREGNFVTGALSTDGGEIVPAGFNTLNNSVAIRAKVSRKDTELGLFFSEFDRGYGSANAGYEYALTIPESKSEFRSYHAYLKNQKNLTSKLDLSSHAVFRATHVLPETGFQYLYRFENLTKSYSAYAFQGYIEEKLLYTLSSKSELYFGIKGALSEKSERTVSLGRYAQNGSSVSTSSWDIAEVGGGLNQQKEYPSFLVRELSSYLLWDNEWTSAFSSSIGVRHDYSSEFGQVVNPRMSLIYLHPASVIGAKLMYATAFRQPGIFELTSEFRGNPNLDPEKINTTELEINSLFLDHKVSLRSTLYYSQITDFIGKVPDANKPSGERFENIGQLKMAGITSDLSGQITKGIRLYSNYNFLTGINTDNGHLYEIERAAQHKINAGLNIKAFDHRLTADIRMNWVSKRKGQQANQWLQTYQNGYAPSYTKMNLVIGYKLVKPLSFQLIVNNLLDEKFYGVGRETGSGFIDNYDYQTNVNPEGLIPAYHPQPGRTFLVRIIYKRHH